MPYSGDTVITGGLIQKNGNTWPVADAKDIFYADKNPQDPSEGYISLANQVKDISEVADPEAIDSRIDDKIDDLDYSDPGDSNGKFVRTVNQSNGKVSITKGNVSTSDVDGLNDALNSKQGTLSNGTGISISNNTVGITDEVNQNVIGTTGYNDLGNSLGVTYKSSEHKLETVIDNMADRTLYLEAYNSSISSFTVTGTGISGQKAEIGDIISSYTLTWKSSIANKSGTPSKVTINDVEVTAAANGSKSYTSQSVGVDTTWNLKVYANGDNYKSSSSKLSFVYRMYYGSKAAQTSYDSAIIKSLSGNVLCTSSDYKRTLTVNVGTTEYIHIAIPSDFGTPTFKVGGLELNFEKFDNITYTNGSVDTTYTVYRSPNAGGGNGVKVEIT